MKITILVLYSLAVAVLTPIMSDLAYKERGYFALGGEYALGFTVPIVISLTKEDKK